MTAVEPVSQGDADSGLPVDDGAGTSRAGAGAHGEHHGPVFYACLVVGWGIIVFGLHGMFADANQTNPAAVFRILIGLNVLNDALVAPMLVVAAAISRRVLPRWALGPVQVGLIATAVVVLYAYPLIGDWGHTVRAGFSRLPWDYAHNTAVVVAVIWAVCALMGAWGWRRDHPRAHAAPTDPEPAVPGED